MKRSNWSLIGIPDHQGVVNVGGRVGAAAGPDAFRKAWKRLKGREDLTGSLVLDGNVEELGFDVSRNHSLAAKLIERAHSESSRSVVVGGGHDHGYSQLLGLSQAYGKRAKLACINIDAHFDVQRPAPLITSGSPFFLALESRILDPTRFVEFGIQPQCNSKPLWDYVENKRVKVVPFEDLRKGKAIRAFDQVLRKLAARSDKVVISLDLDSIAEAFAPGVSAPVAEGFAPEEIFEMMAIAGRQKKVASLGIFELNPEHDIQGRTARLAATAAYHFISQSASS